jgi:malate/lactate dehydrogenase
MTAIDAGEWMATTLARRSTVAIVGAGNVGAAVANDLAVLGACGRIVLHNRGLAKAEGVAYDIADATALLGGVEVFATADWDDLADADVAVVTVGHSIRPGESRLEIADNDRLSGRWSPAWTRSRRTRSC